VAAGACAALAALVAADTPALHTLRECRLGDAGLGPLVDALAHNTHLRVLQYGRNELSEAFMRDRLLPAVHAHPWLQAEF
jgi:hypothetical protein